MSIFNKIIDSLLGRSTPEQKAIKSPAQQQRVIKNPVVEVEMRTGIPEHRKILSLNNEKFAIPDQLKRQFAILEIENGIVAMVSAEDSFGNNQYLTLKQRIKSSGYKLKVESKVSTGELMTLYSTNIKEDKKQDSFADDFSGSDNKKMMHYIIGNAIKMRASDIHICPRFEFGSGVIMFRIDGKIQVWERMPADDLLGICGYMFTKEAEESSRSEPAFNAKKMQSCSIPVQIGKHFLKLRYQSVQVNGGFDVVLRLLFTDKESKVASLETLGYSPSQIKSLDLAVRKTVGGIFIAGVTGSGKSTTLKTLMSLSPTRLERKFYSIEDPVEYKMFGVSQISVQRSSSDKAGGSNAFLEPMRVILRADPDTIMPGEIRDEDSCSMMKGMIQSGHQVMTSIHASSAIEIIERVTSKEFGLLRQSLAARSFISALVYQRLLPKICTSCGKKAEDVIPEDRLNLLRTKFKVDTSMMKACINNKDCEKCGGTGTHGVTVVAEIIMPDLIFLKHVRDNKDIDAEEHWRKTRITGFGSADMTGKTAFEHGLYKVLTGVCDLRDLEDSFEPMETYQIVEMDNPQIDETRVEPLNMFTAINFEDIENAETETPGEVVDINNLIDEAEDLISKENEVKNNPLTYANSEVEDNKETT